MSPEAAKPPRPPTVGPYDAQIMRPANVLRRLFTRPRQLPGCRNENWTATRKLWQSDQQFAQGYKEWQVGLKSHVDEGASLSILKFGDGDYHFLQQTAVGSARPGRRALSLSYSEIDHERFTTGATACDLYACESAPAIRQMFSACLPTCTVAFPAEYCYAAVSSRWIFSLSPSVTIVGADEKLSLIENLLGFPDYREFLGIDSVEFVRIPQRFACDDLDAVTTKVAGQLEGTSSPLVLVGVGHIKSGLLHALPAVRSAVYLDVGSGIDAIAGVIDRSRPFFADWTNFQFRDQSRYENIDTLQVKEFARVRLVG